MDVSEGGAVSNCFLVPKELLAFTPGTFLMPYRINGLSMQAWAHVVFSPK